MKVAKKRPHRSRWRVSSVELMLLGALAVAIIIMSQLSPNFLTSRNVFQITRFIAEIGLISLGMTAVILTGGIDLSVGSMLGISAISMGFLFHQGLSIWWAALAGIAVGTLAGAINGVLITLTRVHPLIITLATLAIFRGLALGISQGQSFRGYPEGFFTIGQGFLGPVPVQLLIFAAVAIVLVVLLSRTVFGRALFGLGHNETAARFSGIHVDKVIWTVYSLSGFLSGLAAVIFVSRVSTARADAGNWYELDAITAVVLGGTALTGGQGGIPGTLLGLLIIGVVRNGLTLAFVPGEVQSVFIGLILIVAVALNQRLRQRRGRG